MTMRFYCRRLYPRVVGVLGLFLLLFCANSAIVEGHGGVVIDSGFTDDFEWLVSIDPYPMTMGDATLTLLVYQIATYEPVDDLKVTLNLATPDSPTVCCAAQHFSGEIDLVIDPELYPGDYSNVVPFDQPGEWALQFVVTVPAGSRNQSFEVVVPLTVKGTRENSPAIAPTPLEPLNVAATATSFAQNVAVARQQNSPLADPISPLATPLPAGADRAVIVINRAWWFWGGVGLLPIILIGWLILRAIPGEDEDT